MSVRTVLFTGAGASRPFGFPVTSEILPQIWEGMSDPAKWRKWAGLRRGRGIERLRDLLHRILPGASLDRKLPDGTSILDVISLVDQLMVEGHSLHPQAEESALVEERWLLQMALNAVIRGQKDPARRRKLAAWLVDRGLAAGGRRMTVISTNYDIAIESAFFSQIRKRKGQSAIADLVDFGIPWRNQSNRKLHLRPPSAPFAIYKLHGSLNSLCCETCGYALINPSQRIGAISFWKERSDFNSCWCGGRLRMSIVAPSFVRSVRDPNLTAIWSAAFEDLRRAGEWIFIGYSLPPEDVAIRSLLLRALHSRPARSPLRVRVVQCETGNSIQRPSQTEWRYRAFFPARIHRRRDYRRDGVEAFIDGLS